MKSTTSSESVTWVERRELNFNVATTRIDDWRSKPWSRTWGN